MSASRTQKATKSMSANGIYYIINIILGLLNRRFLILIMGIDYQGVNGLFSSVLSVLELAELGIGTAIIYHLYKPLAEDDKEEIKSIMHFYKKCYTVIALVVTVIGVLLSINIEFFVGKTNLDLNLRVVFLLMLADVVGTYTFAYKRSILYADQKNYVVANVNTVFVVVYNFLQLVVLFLTHNYYLYLLVKFLTRLGSNVIINIIVNKEYPFLKGEARPLKPEILFDIKQKVKGLMCHKIGTFVVNGTDNIFISKLINLATVGIYANYNYVITAVNSLLNTMIDGATGSVGNLLVKSDQKHSLNVFKEMNLLNLLISTTAISIFSVAVDDFITIFFGGQYLIGRLVLAVVILNMICNNQRRVWGIMKTAAGIQYEDRWVPIYESIVNIVMSYILFQKFGFAGIFMGTLFTQLGVFFYTYPILIWGRVLGKNYLSYITYLLELFVFQILIVAACYYLSLFIVLNNVFVDMIIKALIALALSFIAFTVVFFHTDSYKNLLNRLKGIINVKRIAR